MQLTLRMIAAVIFALVFVPAVMAQSARDIERAENERDLDLRAGTSKSFNYNMSGRVRAGRR